MRRSLPLAVASLAAAAVAATAGAGVAGTPDPCTLVSGGALNAAFGASSDNAQYGTPGSVKSHGVRATDCMWTYGNGQIIVTAGPSSFVAPMPAGTKIVKASGLPTGAKLLVNTRVGNAFSEVVMTRHGHFGAVWGNSFITRAHVIALARRAYLKL